MIYGDRSCAKKKVLRTLRGAARTRGVLEFAAGRFMVQVIGEIDNEIDINALQTLWMPYDCVNMIV